MKTTPLHLLAVLTLGVCTWNLAAQDAGAPPVPRERPAQREAGPGGPGGPGGFGGQRPMLSPVVQALDANSDGEIDAQEIANASAALKKLDKNGDGKLSAEELRPARPQGGPGGPGGAGGGRGQGGRGPGGGNAPQRPPVQ